jgi:hypothetical protein
MGPTLCLRLFGPLFSYSKYFTFIAVASPYIELTLTFPRHRLRGFGAQKYQPSTLKLQSSLLSTIVKIALSPFTTFP